MQCQQEKNLKVIFIIIGTVVLLSFFYFTIFGRALGQKENHLEILFALPNVVLTSNIAPLSNGTYLSKNSDNFIKAMEEKGLIFVEQMGSGYLFEKGGENYLSTSRMYSRYFMIFTEPRT